METPGTDRLTRQEQAQQTRQRLFDAAYSLLQEKDFKDITIGDIVSRAGVSTGTFYLYYASKLDVYYQTYVLSDAYFLSEVAPRVQQGDTRERLLIYFASYAYYNSDYSRIKLTRLLYNGENRNFLRRGEGMHTVLEAIVAHGLQAGELDRALTVEAHCDLLMDMARGLVYRWCISDGAFPLADAMHSAISRLYRALAAPGR